MLRAGLERAVNTLWYGDSRWAWLLLPLAWLYSTVVQRRRHQQRSVERAPPVPVLVVGNVTVGGTGKTPIVVHLVETLLAAGARVGVISRGYGSQAEQFPYLVTAESPVAEAGDEPLLIAARTGIPVMIDPQRIRAYRDLTARFPLDLVISDDGLQHIALPRSRELVVIDGQRGLGNGYCLPAGPLREPVERLREVAAVWVNGSLQEPLSGILARLAPDRVSFHLQPTQLRSLADPSQTIALNGLQKSIYAVAGIANPGRFFKTLTDLGYQVEGVAFPDHHQYQWRDLERMRGKPIVTTEKDAVKMRDLGIESIWVLQVGVTIDPAAVTRLLQGLIPEHTKQ